MKVTLQIEMELEPENELTAKQEQNVTGMMRRLVEHRLGALLKRRCGGEHVATGWEVTLEQIKVAPVSKLR